MPRTKNRLKQKILSMVLDGAERYLENQSDAKNQLDVAVQDAFKKVDDGTKDFIRQRIGQFRNMPISFQKGKLGKYYNREFIIPASGTTPLSPRRAIDCQYRTRPPVNLGHSTDVSRFSGSIDRTGPRRPETADPSGGDSSSIKEYYKKVSLDMNKLHVIEDDDPGPAEIVIVGSASDGTNVHATTTQVIELGDGETKNFYAEEKIAVPQWNLKEDGTSSIVYVCQVMELDATDNETWNKMILTGAGIAEIIVAALLAGGAIGGPTGAIVGAIVGAVAAFIGFLVSLNDDDEWGEHVIELDGPYEKSARSETDIVKIYAPSDSRAHYELHFTRKLFAD